ncbi:MAG: ABC transporter permease [candidate division Zixibacteria bacterium]|nr:ABC transporter permease [candidate division Zixibacteria bacterium]
MMPFQVVKQFFNDMRRQKLRSMLTMFGIFWGTCSIVLLFAFGVGITEAQLKSQKGMGENIAIVWPGITSEEFEGLPKGRRVRPTVDDVRMIKMKAQTLMHISPEYSKWNVMMKAGRNETIRNVIGVWPEFGIMRNLIPDYGSRFLNDRDLAEKRRVVFLGNLLKEDLFGEEEAVGKTVLLNNTPFTIIGIMKEKDQDSSYNGRDSRKAFIPASTFRTMYSRRYVNNFVVQCPPTASMEATKREIYEIMGAKYRFDPDDTEALSIWDTTEGFAFLKNFFMAFSTFLVGIGVATLITGGIGVTNIMNVVLEERTKEIGIKMALGARKSAILSQFLFETMLITGVGGILGFLFAWGVVYGVGLMGLEEYIGVPRVSLFSGALATVLLGLVGTLAGLFPARRAANLQPVQALKLF